MRLAILNKCAIQATAYVALIGAIAGCGSTLPKVQQVTPVAPRPDSASPNAAAPLTLVPTPPVDPPPGPPILMLTGMSVPTTDVPREDFDLRIASEQRPQGPMDILLPVERPTLRSTIGIVLPPRRPWFLEPNPLPPTPLNVSVRPPQPRTPLASPESPLALHVELVKDSSSTPLSKPFREAYAELTLIAPIE